MTPHTATAAPEPTQAFPGRTEFLIPVNAIAYDIPNHRHAALHDQAKLDALAASIKAHGLLQAILVHKAEGEGRGKYILVYGHRRLLAMKQLGESHILAQVRPTMTAKQVLLERAIENLHREDLNPMEQIEAVMQAWEAGGGNARAVARELGVSEQFVADRLYIGLVLWVRREVVDRAKTAIADRSSPDQQSESHHKTLDIMQQHGGGFVQALAFAWRKADALNHRKLYDGFAYYYDEYRRVADQQKGAS